jgi:hypothetical protein
MDWITTTLWIGTSGSKGPCLNEKFSLFLSLNIIEKIIYEEN